MLWARVALQVAAYLWPAYQTWKALEENIPAKKDKWMQYWVIVGFFASMQPLTDVFMFWLPLYYEAKLGFAIYLWSSGLQGSCHVYQQWVQPCLESKEPVIDRWLAETKGSVGDLVAASVSKLAVVVQTKALKLLEQAKQAPALIKAATPDKEGQAKAA